MPDSTARHWLASVILGVEAQHLAARRQPGELVAHEFQLVVGGVEVAARLIDLAQGDAVV